MQGPVNEEEYYINDILIVFSRINILCNSRAYCHYCVAALLTSYSCTDSIGDLRPYFCQLDSRI